MPKRTLPLIAASMGLDLEETIRRMYWDEKKSIHQIAAFFGVQSMSLYRYFKRYHISTRTLEEAMKLVDNKGENNPMFGKPRSEKARKSQAAKLRARFATQPHWSKGRKLSAERIAQMKENKGEKNNNWKGGRRNHDGYVQIYMPEHPYCTFKTNVVYEHRLVMEAYLGRYLQSNEVVHHKNDDRSDNRLENLELINSNAEHLKLHRIMKQNNKKRESTGLISA